MSATIIKKSDHAIHADVLQELKWDTQVDETEVGVEVDRGVVTLSGTVDSYAKKMAAQEAAHRVAGVLDVANDIQIRVPGSLVRTDTEIAQAVRRMLEWDALVPQENIQSTVTNGWVTLEGDVLNWADRNYTERVIRNLAGIRGVTNHITVIPPQVSPEEIRRSIEQALERRAEREAERIHITVKDGSVSLTGRVHNWHEKQAVVGAAGYARGVRKVEDHLNVDPYF